MKNNVFWYLCCCLFVQKCFFLLLISLSFIFFSVRHLPSPASSHAVLLILTLIKMWWYTVACYFTAAQLKLFNHVARRSEVYTLFPQSVLQLRVLQSCHGFQRPLHCLAAGLICLLIFVFTLITMMLTQKRWVDLREEPQHQLSIEKMVNFCPMSLKPCCQMETVSALVFYSIESGKPSVIHSTRCSCQSYRISSWPLVYIFVWKVKETKKATSAVILVCLGSFRQHTLTFRAERESSQLIVIYFWFLLHHELLIYKYSL